MIPESHAGMVNRILPDTSLVLSVRFRRRVALSTVHRALDLPVFTLSGLRKSDRRVTYGSDTANLLVVFREAAASVFFKEPLHELFEEHIPLEQMDGFKGLSQLAGQLAEAGSHRARIDIIEHYLLKRLLRHGIDPLVETAVKNIQAQNGLVRIKDLARSLYISQDVLEKRFRREAGVTPKQFAYITKMKTVVRRALLRHDLTDIAFDAGYYDLPHFNKDFRLFTGQTPTAFMKAPDIM